MAHNLPHLLLIAIILATCTDPLTTAASSAKFLLSYKDKFSWFIYLEELMENIDFTNIPRPAMAVVLWC